MEKLTKAEVDARVLEVLAGQGDYLIHPTATAFALAGLEPGPVEESLARLGKAGHADLFTETIEVERLVPVFEEQEGEGEPVQTGFETVTETAVDDDGEPVVAQHGWSISRAGRRHLKTVRREG